MYLNREGLPLRMPGEKRGSRLTMRWASQSSRFSTPFITVTSVTLVFAGVLLTALGVYDKIARKAGAGTLVPITGFANAMSSPAIEFKSEGFITGVGAKMFAIAGPVIVYGVSASVIYGIILWTLHLLGITLF